MNTDSGQTSPSARENRTHHVRSLLQTLVIVLLLVAMAAPARSEDDKKSEPKKKVIPPYALIFGTVWTPDKRPAYGVPIRIRRADKKKAQWELMSDRRGEFAQRVPAGTADYVIWADLKAPKGKKDWQRPETKVHIENDERVDVSLHLTE